MKNFLKVKNGEKKQIANKPKFTRTIINIFLIFSLLFIFTSVPFRPVHAVSPFVAAINAEKGIWDKFKAASSYLLKKSGAIAYHQALSLALNKIAYDAANYVGSAAAGQKPTFITKNLGDYLKDIGDQSAGQFIESFVNHLNDPDRRDCGVELKNCVIYCDDKYSEDDKEWSACDDDCTSANTACMSREVRDNASTTAATSAYMAATPSFNICGASSLEAKLKIGLGLVEQKRPKAPNCSASKMVKEWGTDIRKKYEDLQNKNFLNNFSDYFDPRSNDIGVFMLAKSDMSSKALIDTQNKKSSFVANKGFSELTNIGGSKVAPPGTSERRLQEASAVKDANIGKMTTDVLVDAGNIAINQLAISLFNNLMKTIAEKNAADFNEGVKFRNYNSDPYSNVGISSLKKSTIKLQKPNFGFSADYDILSSLSICIDSDNPGPDNCVIDNQLSQAISQKETVAEALAKGYLHGTWQVTNSTAGDAYNKNYSLRNIAILIKYRILPIGWQEAAQKIINDSKYSGTTLNDLVSCFDPNDSYTKFSNGFDQSKQGWCQGLVDPNWVLSAPLNYCKKSGYGAQILNTRIVKGSEANGNIPAKPSSINITRADNYCADNQSCIKEDSNGGCQAYGYCTGEKRIWKFNTDSCQPINNTCQTFSGPDGQKVSYLQNTLDYGTCNSGNSGCRQYSFFGNYSTLNKHVSWDKDSSLYLNSNLRSCSNRDSACQGLLRVKPDWGNNLVMNSDFFNDQVGDSTSGSQLNNWPLIGNVIHASIVDSSQDPGQLSGRALKLEISQGGVSGLESSLTRSLLPANLQIIPKRAYTLSADVYIKGDPNSGTKVSLSLGPDVTTVNTPDKWQHVTVTSSADSSYNDSNFKIIGQNLNHKGIFYLKNIKFEMSDWNTDYSVYGYTPEGSAKIYEKLLPKYLENVCYVKPSGVNKDYSLKTDAPQICSNYARKCNLAEVGCNAYTNSLDAYTVDAKVNTGDYCSSECLGYDVYTVKGTYFNSPKRENLIPSTARNCSAASVGCNEFTNLDTLNQGGEQKEYYTSLKQCIKPNASQCANFYAWQGQGDGYQLQAYSLKEDNGLPVVTSDDSALCNSFVFNLPVNDPAFNPDCRQFYSGSGAVSYHLISRTITCSDNCHAYRMTVKNVDQNIKNSDDCAAKSDRHWDSKNSNCQVCLNGGIWDDSSEACIYQAIPGQGQICTANENNCREYNGNQGSNVSLISYNDFEQGLNNWSSTCSTPSSISISPVSNNKNGHSLFSKATCNGGTGNFAAAELNLNGLLKAGSAYTLKFLARANTNSSLKIYFINEDTQSVSNNFTSIVVKGGNEWHLYQANLAEFDQSVGNNEKLVIIGSSDFYLDDFILSNISDRYYLIDNSSQIPNSCYYDTFGNYQGVDYNLGCSAYTDFSGNKVNLHKFSGLCSASAVGCEQMIDTQNYTPAGDGFWENGKATSTCSSSDTNCVHVLGDSALYAVYDPNKQCSAANQGCSLLGQGQGGASLTSWVDVYKLNNPDNYSENSKTLCGQENLGCEAWNSLTDNTTSYFKDPGSNVCEYRLGNNSTFDQAWYKIPVKRCDLNENNIIDSAESEGEICLNDDDCLNSKCILDNNDYLCDVSYFKTIGLGGSGNEVPVPDSSVGICSPKEAGCTEYIDPLTKFNPNLVKNPNFIEHSLDGAEGADSGNATGVFQQVINLKQHQLYSFNVNFRENALSPNKSFSHSDDKISDGAIKITSLDNSLRQLLNNNTFANPSLTFRITSTSNKPIIFDSGESTKVLLSGRSLYLNSSVLAMEIKELAVNYQLQKNIDKETCRSNVQFNNGCILFNERTVNGASGLSSLNFDAYQTNNESNTNPVSPSNCQNDGSCTANQIIKVRPDRTCSQWLACNSYSEDSSGQKDCYSFGECNRLDSNNECANWINSEEVPVSSVAVDSNASGYNILSDYNFSQMKVVGNEINDSHFDFENHSLPTCTKSSISNTVCLIDNPDIATSAVKYPAQGKAYLSIPVESSWSTGKKYLGIFNSSDSENTEQNVDYYLNYLVNTQSLISSQAEIIVRVNYLKGDASILKFYVSNGLPWTREINKISVKANAKSISISLGTKRTNNSLEPSGRVFFDDLNVSPVLKVAPNKYLAPECRLYPTSDSLTCLNGDTNTIKPGLEGYCLEHDLANPGVCLLWYPLDNIPTPSLSAVGYQGKFPLNYCSAVNGNFELLENRKAFWIKERQIDNSGGKCADGSNSCTIDKDSSEGCYKFDGIQHKLAYCNAENDNELISKDYVLWISNKKCGSGCKDYRKYICVPRTDRLIPQMSQTMSKSLHPDYDNNDWEKCSDELFVNGYGVYNGLSNHEDTNMSPPVAVYDYNNPISRESYLKYPYAINGMSDDKIFKLTCNSFVQVADANDINKAWVGRIKDTNNTLTTPSFFSPYNAAPYNLKAYGQSRFEIPFGAASSPHNNLFTSGLITLNNSKTNTDSNLAGRPYSCQSGSDHIGCNSIGYCQNNPDIYCLNGDSLETTSNSGFKLAKETCGGVGGDCIPLWNEDSMIENSSAPSSNATNILKNIFLSGKAYKYNSSTLSYLPAADNDFNYSNYGPHPIKQCTDNIRSHTNTFCAVYPIVYNLSLFDNNDNLIQKNIENDTDFSINKGWHKLTFNSKVNSEQQPLNSININWGDGSLQTVTNQDNHPDSNYPHIFYHNYSKKISKAHINVTVVDNWGFYGLNDGSSNIPSSLCNTGDTETCNKFYGVNSGWSGEVNCSDSNNYDPSECSCSAGYYEFDDNCVICPAGYYCNNGTKYSCPSESTSPQGSDSDADCTCVSDGYCDEHDCGSDNCHNSCGSCWQNQRCNAGHCENL